MNDWNNDDTDFTRLISIFMGAFVALLFSVVTRQRDVNPYRFDSGIYTGEGKIVTSGL